MELTTEELLEVLAVDLAKICMEEVVKSYKEIREREWKINI